jgi:pyruvate dehydrogenase E1 component alpha subunit/2-oxoisovalerate dehydrogenase E1 component alpha subunit
LKLYKLMVLARASDDRMAKLKAQNEVAGSAFLGRGQEAFSGAAGLQLKAGDIFAPCIRDQAGRFAFGETPLDAVRTVLVVRPMRGRDGNIHRGISAASCPSSATSAPCSRRCSAYCCRAASPGGWATTSDWRSSVMAA